MARILYGISGDGFGHATRSKEIISHLINSGHQVCLVSYDKGYDLLSQHFEVEKISGLRLSYADNEVKYLATVSSNVLKSKASIESLDKVKTLTREFKPDLVITDFEPTVSLVANLFRLPLISIDNMHVITKTDVEIPEAWYSDYLIAKLVVRLMVFNAKRYFILSFFNCQPNNNKITLVKPVVRREILELQPSIGQHLLVYLTNEDDSVISVLETSGQPCIVYGLKKRNLKGNLIFKQFGASDYLHDLATCRGIVATAGFSLISEALYLHKPFLALPVKSQFEQLLNAYYLEQIGYGLMTQDFRLAVLEQFLSSLELYQRNLNSYVQDGNEEMFNLLDKAIVELI